MQITCLEITFRKGNDAQTELQTEAGKVSRPEPGKRDLKQSPKPVYKGGATVGVEGQ